MVRRLLGAGRECVVFDVHPQASVDLVKRGATAAPSLTELVKRLKTPRPIWIMVPAAVVDATLDELAPLLAADDVVIDGGNSYYHDDIRRAEAPRKRGIHYIDVGTSGGIWGFERGYCQMIGGEGAIVQRLDRIFAALAPGLDGKGSTGKEAGDRAPAPERGYIHCGPAGAGHFVKMVHSGIEYGFMAAYAEGLNILRHANAGKGSRTEDAETAPLRTPSSTNTISTSPTSSRRGVTAPVLSTALTQRFASRGEEDFANKVLSAMRYEFGGHEEKK